MTLRSKKGFTLVELMTVVGLIAIIMAALVTSLVSAQQRARQSKAATEVKTITQAILASENFDDEYEIPVMTARDADASSLAFLIGKGGSDRTGGKMPAILLARLTSGGKILDPWNTPYKVTIKKRTAGVRLNSTTGNLQTGYFFPNFYRLSAEERQ